MLLDFLLGGLLLTPLEALINVRTRLTSNHAASRDRVEQLLDFGGTMDKFMRPELESWVLDQFYEGYKEPPWMRPVNN